METARSQCNTNADAMDIDIALLSTIQSRMEGMTDSLTINRVVSIVVIKNNFGRMYMSCRLFRFSFHI